MEPFTGEYDKIEYRIRLKNGEVIEKTWPNAGVFHDLIEPGKIYDGVDVEAFEPNEMEKL